MKKQATETIAANNESDPRLRDIESRLAKLDPQPPIEVMEPYPISSQVFCVADQEASYPLTVIGYEKTRGIRRVLVTVPDDPHSRSMPLVSVQSLEKCKAIKTDRFVAQIEDPTAREYWEGKRAAEAAAKAPAPIPPPKEPKYRWAE
jgi:hypothetical protein